MRETEADSLLSRTSEGITRTAIDPNTREATIAVVSEDEDITAPIEALEYLDVSCSKGNSLKRYSLSSASKQKTTKQM